MTAEQAVRARALAVLAGDSDLAGRVHGIFDGAARRASAPYVVVGAAESVDWGTKDQPGREVRLTVTLVGVDPGGPGDAGARIGALAPMLRGGGEGWTIAAVRTLRSRFSLRRAGGWQQDMIVRCRCLAG